MPDPPALELLILLVFFLHRLAGATRHFSENLNFGDFVIDPGFFTRLVYEGV